MLGDKLSSKMELWGNSADHRSYKCLMTAAEKGIDVEGKFVDASGGGAPDFKSVSAFGHMPCIRDREFVVWGTLPIMSYLDDKGFGPSLIPRNANLRAIMYQWVYNAMNIAAQQIDKLMSGGADAAMLTRLYDALEKHLHAEASMSQRRRGDFIATEFSMADIHWGACTHFCMITGHASLIDSRPGVKTWWGKVKEHPSTSKEKILCGSVLPAADELKAQKLRGVSINVK
jgi:glutathione S-transferase